MGVREFLDEIIIASTPWNKDITVFNYNTTSNYLEPIKIGGFRIAGKRFKKQIPGGNTSDQHSKSKLEEYIAKNQEKIESFEITKKEAVSYYKRLDPSEVFSKYVTNAAKISLIPSVDKNAMSFFHKYNAIANATQLLSSRITNNNLKPESERISIDELVKQTKLAGHSDHINEDHKFAIVKSIEEGKFDLKDVLESVFRKDPDFYSDDELEHARTQVVKASSDYSHSEINIGYLLGENKKAKLKINPEFILYRHDLGDQSVKVFAVSHLTDEIVKYRGEVKVALDESLSASDYITKAAITLTEIIPDNYYRSIAKPNQEDLSKTFQAQGLRDTVKDVVFNISFDPEDKKQLKLEFEFQTGKPIEAGKRTLFAPLEQAMHLTNYMLGASKSMQDYKPSAALDATSA